MFSFTKIAEYDQIPEGKAKKISVNGKTIALFKYNKNIYAIQNSCPHQGADLADGYVQDGQAVCPLHRWMFNLQSGAFSGNESIRIPTFKTKVEGNKVYILIDAN